MNIDNYILKLQNLKNILPTEIDRILLSKQSHIVGLLKARLYNQGTDGDGNLIGHYAKGTLASKKANNQKTSFITLRDTGHWYNAMYLESKNGEYLIDSSDRKTAMLIEIYGDSILDLTIQQQEYLVSQVIEPELQKLLDEFGDFEIEI